jgi:hypothetical protein
MATGGRDAAYYGPIFLFAVALPFFVVYFRSPENWWAIIPAGSVSVVAIIAAVAIAGWINDGGRGGFVSAGMANAILMSGLAITFAVVWLRHDRSWAKIVMIILALMAVASVFFATSSQILWPMAIILVGIYLFYTALRPKTA